MAARTSFESAFRSNGVKEVDRKKLSFGVALGHGVECR